MKKKWETEFIKYLTNKFTNVFGEDVEVEITKIEPIFDISDIDTYSINDMALFYAYSVMIEDFENSKIINEKFSNKKLTPKIESIDGSDDGLLNIYDENNIVVADIKLKMYSDCIIIDFEGENF